VNIDMWYNGIVELCTGSTLCVGPVCVQEVFSCRKKQKSCVRSMAAIVLPIPAITAASMRVLWQLGRTIGAGRQLSADMIGNGTSSGICIWQDRRISFAGCICRPDVRRWRSAWITSCHWSLAAPSTTKRICSRHAWHAIRLKDRRYCVERGSLAEDSELRFRLSKSFLHLFFDLFFLFFCKQKQSRARCQDPQGEVKSLRETGSKPGEPLRAGFFPSRNAGKGGILCRTERQSLWP